MTPNRPSRGRDARRPADPDAGGWPVLADAAVAVGRDAGPVLERGDPPENDRFADGPTGPPSGQPVLTLALAYVATVGVAVALLDLSAPLAARGRARRRSRWERFAS